MYCKKGLCFELDRRQYKTARVTVTESVFSDYELENSSMGEPLYYASAGMLKSGEYYFDYSELTIIKSERTYSIDQQLISCEVISIRFRGIEYPVIVKTNMNSDVSRVIAHVDEIGQLCNMLFCSDIMPTTMDFSDALFDGPDPNEARGAILDGEVLSISHELELSLLRSALSYEDLNPAAIADAIVTGISGDIPPESVLRLLQRETVLAKTDYNTNIQRGDVLFDMQINTEMRDALMYTTRYNTDKHLSMQFNEDAHIVSVLENVYYDAISAMNYSVDFDCTRMDMTYDNRNEIVTISLSSSTGEKLRLRYDLVLIAVLHPDLNISQWAPPSDIYH